MRRDDFEFLTIGLLMALIVSVYVVGDILFAELVKRPRVVAVYRGGRDDEEETIEHETA